MSKKAEYLAKYLNKQWKIFIEEVEEYPQEFLEALVYGKKDKNSWLVTEFEGEVIDITTLNRVYNHIDGDGGTQAYWVEIDNVAVGTQTYYSSWDSADWDSPISVGTVKVWEERLFQTSKRG